MSKNTYLDVAVMALREALDNSLGSMQRDVARLNQKTAELMNAIDLADRAAEITAERVGRKIGREVAARLRYRK